MTTVLIVVIVLVVVAALLAAIAVTSFNRLGRADVAAQEALGGIDVELTRRAELIPNLVNSVKGFAGHEKDVLQQVTAARAGVAAAANNSDVRGKAAADQHLQNALVQVNAVAERYPDLKANQNFLGLQQELTDTENKLSFARQYYNDAVSKLNGLIRTIPTMFFAGMAHVSTREFYEAPTANEAPPSVNFD